MHIIKTFGSSWKLSCNNQVILVPRSFVLKYFFNLKKDYFPRKIFQIKPLKAFEKAKRANATYGSCILLTTILKNENLKYTAKSQIIFFNSFLSFYIYFSLIIFYCLFSNIHAQRNIPFIIYIVYRILWVFAMQILHSVENMYWWMFLRGLFLLLFQTKYICCS